MRILYLSRAYTSHDWRFIAAMTERGHAVWHAHFGDGLSAYERRPLPPGAQHVRWRGDEARVTTPRDVLPLMRDFERVLDDIQPQLIHAGPVQTCALLPALAGAHPLLVMSWGSDMLTDAERDDEFEWATRFALGRADGLQSDSATVRQSVRRFREFDEGAIAQFPWGIDTAAFFPAEPPRPAPADAREVVVLSTRSWEPHYGIDVLVRGFALAHAQDRRLRLALAGDGSLEAVVRGIVAEHRLHHAVKFLGRINNDQFPATFRGADVYLSCAHNDGTSISLLEAMATGLPAIVTDVPSNAEWVTHDVNGWLANRGDAESVGAHILLAAQLSQPRAQAIRQANRAIALRRANWRANVERLFEVYARLVPT